ncbi:hypothetical protein DFQ28_007352 [Apophysomyces sp. BC1034]|nr:hypothetical protein DFQ29_002798 [Apophysomyces sp. BC1021]KAG0192879.1 hypothetical protein DFQ28_007352 [Apophysomyces sp. BC1034]
MKRGPFLLLFLFCILLSQAYAQDSATGGASTASATDATGSATGTSASATATSATSQQAETTTAAATTTVAATTTDTPSSTITPSATTETTTTTTTSTTSSASSTPSVTGCFSDSAFSSTDYFAGSKLTVPNDAQFNVTYANTYKIVQNKVLSEFYVLHCTQNPPNVTNIQSKTFIRIPVTNIAAIDTRVIGFLDLLKQNEHIVYVGNVSNVTSPDISPMPELFNESTVDRNRYDLAVYPVSSPNDPKGVGLGMNLNASPLTLAQWVMYMALFTNQEKQSEQIYSDIKANYETFRDSINGAAIDYKRNVTFMSYDPMSTRFSVMTDQYFRNLTADAGANLTVPTLANPGDPSTMKGQLQNSSLVLDLTPAGVFKDSFDAWQEWIGYSKDNITSAANQALERFKTTKPYINDPNAPPFERHNQLWRFDLVANRDAIDWWTRGFARPDLVIQDLIQAQFPDFFKGGRDRMFLRHFSDNEASRQANQKSYQCNLDNFKLAERVQYANHAQDAPSLEVNNQFPLAGIIGGSIAGGLVVLACLAACIVMLRRKIKDRTSKRFTLLREDPLAVDDKEPMMLMEPTNENTGRLGGSGSREMV